MPEALVPTQQAIDALLAELRRRMEEALSQGRRVNISARAGIDVTDFSAFKEDGSYELHLRIERKK